MSDSTHAVALKQGVLVTGAGSGIGRACALAFAKDGATVMVADQDESRGIETARMVEVVGGKAFFRKCDVAHPDEVRDLFRDAILSLGRLDVAINNAGIEGARATTADYTLEDWDRALQLKTCSESD